MRTRLTLTGIAAASLLAAGLIAAAPAYAAAPTASVSDSSAAQYHVSCNSQSTCNTEISGPLQIQFSRTAPTTKNLGIFYQITNGTAVDGTDFNVAATGEVIIPAGQFVQDLLVSLVNEGMFPYTTTKSFTIAITGTTSSIAIGQGTATATITGGNIPQDCSFTWISTSSQSLTCTQRPATQVWTLQVLCLVEYPMYAPQDGNQVTGNGTSTVSNCTDLKDGALIIIS